MKVTGSTIQQLEKDRPKSRCRKWRLWATTAEGRKSRRFEGTYTQAQEALAEFVSKLEDMVPDSETFGAYAESWARWRRESGRLSKASVSEDRRKVAALRRTPLDGMRLDSIGPEQCRDALMWLKTHKVKGGEYSNTSMARFSNTLSLVMQQAEDDGRIASNPMRSVKPPKPDTVEKEALSPLEIQLFLNRLDEMQVDGFVMAVYLITCLGLRRGEACAIADSDISGGLARVDKSVSHLDGSIGQTKTKAGVRTLPVPPRLQAKVEEWRSLRRSLGWESCETLCCNSAGGVMRPHSLWRWWRLNAPGLGCDGMVLHQLRHSNLSMMARHMSPYDLQRYAGWASINMAMVYVHDDVETVARAVSEAWA